MDREADIWHYPRPAVARAYLAQLETGLVNILVLFERRRSGKTELLLRDVAPAAEAAGYDVLYISLWEAAMDPAGLFASAFEEANRPGSLAERMRRALTTPITRLKFGGKVAGVGGDVEIDLSSISDSKTRSSAILAMNHSCGKLLRRGRRVLLLVDEFQELARSSDNEPLIKALRTLLDTHRDRMKAIFTGSSREGLQAMFAQSAAPFFRSGTSVDLPPMDRGFVQHMLGAYHAVTSRDADEAAASQCFEQLKRSPFYFRRLVLYAIQIRETDFRKAMHGFRAKLPAEMGFIARWTGMRGLEQELLRLIADGETRLFAQETRNKLARMVKRKSCSTSEVQAALQRMMRAGILLRLHPRGPFGGVGASYVPEDDEFAEWARQQPR